jgi:signal transduction histidine kinase
MAGSREISGSAPGIGRMNHLRIGMPAAAFRRASGAMRALSMQRPPFRSAEFWRVQALVIAIAAGHALLEMTGALDDHEPLYLLPASLFLVPVVYAALNFGLAGSLPTALWCIVLTVPNLLLFHFHQGVAYLGELWQLLTVAATAIFVGHRVDRESRARRDAERREADRRISEAKYRGIVDNVTEPILLLDEHHVVEEANAAAAAFFGRPIEQIRGERIEALVGREMAEIVMSGESGGAVRRLTVGGREAPIWVEPLAMGVSDAAGAHRLQVVLRDVTVQHERQQGLEGYARQTLSDREEEHRRIARELHDGPLQSLVLLWRKLDALEGSTLPDGAGALDEARSLAEQVADELRRFSRDLRPSILDDLGLAAALKSEVQAFGRRSGLGTRFGVTGEVRRMGPELELTMLRIVQEALRNVERHAEARNVIVRLAFRADCVRLTITDDGRGMPEIPSASTLVAAGRLGIVGMQERARLAGATLSIRPRQRSGLMVEAIAHA